MAYKGWKASALKNEVERRGLVGKSKPKSELIELLEKHDRGEFVRYKLGREPIPEEISRPKKKNKVVEYGNPESMFHGLPMDVINNIARFLDGRSLQNFGITCKDIYWEVFRPAIKQIIRPFMHQHLPQEKHPLLNNVKDKSFTPLALALFLHLLQKYRQNPRFTLDVEWTTSSYLLTRFIKYRTIEQMQVRKANNSEWDNRKELKREKSIRQACDIRLNLVNSLAKKMGFVPSFSYKYTPPRKNGGSFSIKAFVANKKLHYSSPICIFIETNTVEKTHFQLTDGIESEIFLLGMEGILERKYDPYKSRAMMTPMTIYPSYDECESDSC